MKEHEYPMLRTATIVLIATILFPAWIRAQDGSFTAAVDPSSVAAGQQFKYTLTFTGSDMNSLRNLKAPDFGQFVVISGPNQSTNMQWINGTMSASVAYAYVLYARQPGKYRIGAASIEYKGKTLTSSPVSIPVTAGNPAPKGQPSQPGIENIGDNLFIRAAVDRQRVRQGEQLTVTFKLYTRLSVSGYDLTKAPTFEGFWSEDFDMPKQPEQSNETVNGKQYRVAVIKRSALFATQAGTLTIAPLEVRCAVQIQQKRRGNDLFDSFFNDPFFQQVQTANFDFKSNPLKITVDPLPASAPASFSGAVGAFQFSASVDKKEVKAGDPITLRLTVTGTGNISLVTLPKPNLPSDIETYDPKINAEVNRDGGVIKGKKTAEYLLIPRNAGQRSIEPMAFAYFDLSRREYVVLHSPRFDLTIAPGKDFSDGGSSIASKEDVRLLGEDIRFLKLTPGTLERTEESGTTSTMVWLALVVPPVLFAGAWGYRRRLERQLGDMPRLLFETAGREASKRLKKAKGLLEQGDTEQYHAELLRALTQYLQHKLRMPKASLSTEDAVTRLRAGGVGEEVLQSLRSCIERAEFARYAPAADTTAARKDLLDAAAGAISGIDQSFNRRKAS